MRIRSRREAAPVAGRPGQNAFTLVELLVALVLALFLIGGVLQIFIGGKHAYGELSRFTGLHENLRFTTDFMTRDIRPAGLRVDLGEPAGGVVAVVAPNEAGRTHRFAVRKHGVNCLGESGDWVTSEYRVVDQELRCRNGNGDEQFLIDNVRSMRVFARDADGQEGAAAWDDPVALRIRLVLESSAGGNETREHTVEFIVALRNYIYHKYNET